jgi:hypothetical protein
MDDMQRTLKPWVTFAGCVLVVAVLYWAQAVLVPIALAILLTFVLTPPALRDRAADRPADARIASAGTARQGFRDVLGRGTRART